MDINESYDIEIYIDDHIEELKRPGMVKTYARGIRTLHHLKEIRWIFESMISDMGPDARISATRNIQFYCHVCRSFIGSSTIPLKIVPFRRHVNSDMNAEVGINIETHRCMACGHYTRYDVQDPILSTY